MVYVYSPPPPPRVQQCAGLMPAAMAMLKSIFIKVSVLLKQLEAEAKQEEAGAEVFASLASRALLPDVLAAKPERVDQTTEEIGGESLRGKEKCLFAPSKASAVRVGCAAAWAALRDSIPRQALECPSRVG